MRISGRASGSWQRNTGLKLLLSCKNPVLRRHHRMNKGFLNFSSLSISAKRKPHEQAFFGLFMRFLLCAFLHQCGAFSIKKHVQILYDSGLNIHIEKFIPYLLFVTFPDMGVDIHGSGYLRMAEQILCIGLRDAVFEQHGGVGVAQLVRGAGDTG